MKRSRIEFSSPAPIPLAVLFRFVFVFFPPGWFVTCAFWHVFLVDFLRCAFGVDSYIHISMYTSYHRLIDDKNID